MESIKRVLWVEDNSNGNQACKLFRLEETKIVKSMDEAIQEFSGENLYLYDTIVLDINFDNGIDNPDVVIPKLREKIYLNKDQANKSFVEDNGGYLLFLYLLEQGYPSNQVAFLTGDPRIVSQLKKFNEQCIHEMSIDDIANAIIQAWKQVKKETSNEDYYCSLFENKLYKLPIDEKYMKPKFINYYEDNLIGSNWDGIKKIIASVPKKSNDDPIEGTSDKMIFRFHDANLNAPNYFSKRSYEIKGHNRSDAQNWLDSLRTKESCCRWLTLDAGQFVEDCFRSNESMMNKQIKKIFNISSGDGGIRMAFRQMYLVFEGLHTEKHRGPYYQAIMAMLIPFEAQNKEPQDKDDNDTKVRKMFAYCSKQARNYCAHNYMGTTLAINTTLFLLMISMTAILNSDQCKEKNDWYQNSKELLISDLGQENIIHFDSHDKILSLMNDLLDKRKINYDAAKNNRKELINEATESTSARDILDAMGYNKEMNKSRVASTNIREEYYVFTLASYIVGCFNYDTIDSVEKMYSKPIAYIYEVALNIVLSYEYPFLD